MSAKAATPNVTFEVPTVVKHRVGIVLEGDSPLICHAWSDKAKKMILDKQMKKAKGGKEAKDPEQDFHDSLYHLPEGGHGFPVVAFKAAAVGACRYVDGLTMTIARGSFHINGELVKIDAGEPTMREDMVRVGMGTADIRYRGQFDPWRVTLDTVFNPNALSLEQIVNLFNIAGFGVGVGEWRPEKDGQYGRFHVVEAVEVN